MPVRIETDDFDVARELAALRGGDARVGAVAAFVGTVRDVNDAASVATMTLEHNPGMTEKALAAIVDEAKARWDIYDALVVHRVGELKPADQIVLVGVTSAHRGDALAGAAETRRLNGANLSIIAELGGIFAYMMVVPAKAGIQRR